MAKKYSLKRMTGVTSAKRKISRTTGVPLSKSGRKRKVKKLATGGSGCLLQILMVLLLVLGVVVVIIK